MYHEDDVNPDTNVFSNGGPPEEDMDATSTRSHSEGIEIHQRYDLHFHNMLIGIRRQKTIYFILKLTCNIFDTVPKVD